MADNNSTKSRSYTMQDHRRGVENALTRDLEGGAGIVDDAKIYAMREMTREMS